ncbi:MAG: hypothetical protein A3D52_00870 [Candidatus Taylorbacteria bacterium RIFCSPHIGHO2_02_FULL_44_36]|uniref:NTP pyrophosphohydrolase MazG-like domain-containing protein n=1 Tax=Candidatus Taylorbacteria bacterium RIFCSPLOWO2_12_FULL_44_15c TaxID=1802333 RepID=A0A1G2P5F0_9BACT|nr:MAG: hypothetical protein A3D52_00870 [Candidatus Taylorbacteria bacterium RIFCSPHIGHO2_02_FULL_44_36]OHA38698.1 MAG: hypothetical protein A3I97_00780 [Candidatus Taylorbacteria bacterium RIFCSPLOWO2_02_FULL_44_35]OHA43568.1 MAG: hypothetical protein A3G03_02725 [Candidatus Taylorbacteria bacterium RIFCSPLOWO2_12_FULL_44_15c]
MTFEEYQKKSRKTALYPKVGTSFVYPTLGLAGEAGEVVEKVKKIFRDDNGKVTVSKKEEIKKELGDVLWYLSQVATEFGLSFAVIAKTNLDKLRSRVERGRLQGSGDNR